MFAITTYLYARAGEVNAMTWDDVDLDRGVVHIHASVNRRTGEVSTTKTENTRRVPIDPALLPLLQAMHEESGRPHPCSCGERIMSTPTYGQGAIDRLARAAGQAPQRLREAASVARRWARPAYDQLAARFTTSGEPIGWTHRADVDTPSELEGAPHLPLVLTVDEVAELLRVDRKSVYAAIQRGEIPGVRRLGRPVRLHRDTVLRWLSTGQDRAPRHRRIP